VSKSTEKKYIIRNIKTKKEKKMEEELKALASE